eukprot:CAMPEP_0117522158 /NCGR_PEP_ID=MMETSP0784-20121206/34062_1 /TAXON_ID=39447 /ORGANISM="" /LENGTH=255 /DNA_ID=CAMNT_0005318219 /DNA_START=201 /DNA_END=968 /DNA_ORIENTATION=-
MPLPPWGALHVRLIGLTAIVGGVGATVVVFLQLLCLADGVYLYLSTGLVTGDCAPLERWLIFVCILFALTRLCNIVFPALVWLAFCGKAMRSKLPSHCKESVPRLWFFVDEVFMNCMVTLGFTAACALSACIIWYLSDRLHQQCGPEGPAPGQVVQRLLAEPLLSEVGSDMDCPICLEAGTPRNARWRNLPCMHVFHEQCLLNWLQKARRCPICRLDLREAYRYSIRPLIARASPYTSGGSGQVALSVGTDGGQV